MTVQPHVHVPGSRSDASPARRLPLATLLSQILIAFTIEFDNEAEHRSASAGARPWLVSLAMWANYLRFLDEAGMPIREFESLVGSNLRLNAFERWRYVTVEPGPADRRSKPPLGDRIIRLTPSGRKACEIWQPLPGVIERRWRDRFGEAGIDRLRASLGAIAGRVGTAVPRYLPVTGYEMFAMVSPREQTRAAQDDAAADPPDLSALLSGVLLAFTIEFEREWPLSLPHGANVLRVLSMAGERLRDLPRLTGVSKEAVSVSSGSWRSGAMS